MSENGGECQIRFVTSDYPSIAKESISVPLNCTATQLKSLVEGLAQEKLDNREFDFLIANELLRATLAQHLKENAIEVEKELEVVVIEKQSAPEPEHSYNAEDWISDVAALGEVCLIAAYDGTLALWDAVEEELLFQIVCGRDASKADPVKCCSFIESSNEDSITVVGGGLDSDLAVWCWDKNRSSKPKPLYSLRGHHGSVEDVLDLGDGILVSAGADKTIKIWRDLEQPRQDSNHNDDLTAKKRAKREERGKILTTDINMTGHSESIMSLTKMSNTEVVSASVDNTIRVWDLNKLQEENVLQGVKAHFCVDYSPHKKLLATGSSDRHVRLWDARTTTGKVSAAALTSHSLWVSSVKWSPNKENQLLSGSYDTVVKVWDVRSTKTPLFDMQKHNEKVLALDWSKSANLVVSGGADQKIHTYRFKQ